MTARKLWALRPEDDLKIICTPTQNETINIKYRLWTADVRKTGLCTSWRGSRASQSVSWSAPGLVSCRRSSSRCPRISGRCPRYRRPVPGCCCWRWSMTPRPRQHWRRSALSSIGPTRSAGSPQTRAVTTAVRLAVPGDPAAPGVLVRPVRKKRIGWTSHHGVRSGGPKLVSPNK